MLKSKKMRQEKIPQWLAITGQSGSGKGTAAQILKEFCEKEGQSVLHINTGDLFANQSKNNTYLSRKITEINNQARISPKLISSSFYFQFMYENLNDGQIIIHEGVPRQIGQFDLMMELVEYGIIDSLLILEIRVPDDICRDRLIKRTSEDLREDLSIKNNLGVPDLNKIDTKLAWWTNNREKILDEIRFPVNFISIPNSGSIENLKSALKDLFF